jgi:Na+/melibiose symporter-like transporter
MDPAPGRAAAAPSPAAALPPAQRARGRRLALASHPFGMTHRIVFTEHLPTLALVALGASEAQVGFQRTLVYAAMLLQLAALRWVGRVRKRSILLAGQVLALAGAAPLVAFGAFEGASGVALALASFGVAAAGIALAETVWFPILHGFQERDQVGRFFSQLRTGWHVVLIGYFLAARAWLAAHPGRFAPLFAVGFAAGLVRLALVVRFPERSEGTGSGLRVRDALVLLRRERLLRRYLLGIALGGALRGVVFTFALVLMRRVLGLADGQILYATVALYAGGLASLWFWGRAVDRLGPEPVFRATSLGQALLALGLLGVGDASGGSLALAVALFFGIYALGAGFDVADTHVLFALAPDEAPARTLVAAKVVDGALRAVLPVAAGLALERLLAAGFEPLTVYRGLFAACAAGIALASLPLRAFRRA